MKIVYLDQNKWIDLARAVKSPADYPEQRKVLEALVEEASAGRVAVLLTISNIYETHKIANPERRNFLAYVQTTLSQGLVFRGRHKRLEIEVSDVLRARFGLEPLPREQRWFLSKVFFEAQMEWDDPRNIPISERVLDAIRRDPPRFLFKYLTETPENVRVAAVSKFSRGSEMLREGVEERRARDLRESLSMRRKLYSARLMMNELELILRIARNAGLPPTNETELLRKNARKIINDCPTYFIEREMTLRLESQSRAINENDFRDMQTFCAIVAYADIVVAENLFSNVAMQAGLHNKYETHILTNLLEVTRFLTAG